MTHNGSDKGYMDLALLSYCKGMVASQGSLAKHANMLNHQKGKILILPKVAGKPEIQVKKDLDGVVELIRDNFKC